MTLGQPTNTLGVTDYLVVTMRKALQLWGVVALG